jgi:hypothetical protein
MPSPRNKLAINLNHEGSKSTKFDPKGFYSVSWWLIISRRAVGWFLPTALFALMPKCFLCVVVYAGLGAALGLGRSEICGAPPGSWVSSLAWLGIAGGLGTFGFLASCRRVRPAPTEQAAMNRQRPTLNAEAREWVYCGSAEAQRAVSSPLAGRPLVVTVKSTRQIDRLTTSTTHQT